MFLRAPFSLRFPATALVLALSLSIISSTQGLAESSSQPLKGSVRMESLDRLMLEDKYSEAAAAYQRIFAQDPNNLSAQCGLGMALAKQFKLDAAQEQFDKVLATNPKFAKALIGTAIVTMYRLQSSNKTYLDDKANLLKQAETAAKAALEVEPQSADGHLTLGNCLKEQGKLDDAATQYSETIKLDGKSVEALTQLATIELSHDALNDAERHFKEAAEISSASSTAHYGLGRVLLKQGKTDEALKQLNTALYLSPNSAPVHEALGAAYEAQGNTVAAVRDYQEAIRIKPENLQAYFRIADIHATRGDLEQSITDLHSALELEPNNSDMHLFIATQLLGLERLDDAITEFKTVLELDPHSVAAALGLARSSYLKAHKETDSEYHLSDEFAEAQKILDSAVTANPKNAQLKMAQDQLRMLSGKAIRFSDIGEPQNLAESLALYELLFESGSFSESDRLATKMIGSTDSLKQVFQIADTAFSIRDLATAEMAYNRAANMDKGSQRVRLALSRVKRFRDQAVRYSTTAGQLAKRKQVQLAIQKYNDALACDARLADAQIKLAELLAKLKYQTPSDLRDAAGHYRRYLELAQDLESKDRESIKKRADKLDDRAQKTKS